MKKNVLLMSLALMFSAWGAVAQAGVNANILKPVPKGYTAIPSKANGSGVRVLVKGTPQAKEKQRVTVTIMLDAVSSLDGAAASFSADEGLIIANHPGTVNLELNRSKTINLTVQADQPGLYYINVFTKQNGQTSAASVPVKVGHGQLRTKPTVQTTPDGQRVITMPSK